MRTTEEQERFVELSDQYQKEGLAVLILKLEKEVRKLKNEIRVWSKDLNKEQESSILMNRLGVNIDIEQIEGLDAKINELVSKPKPVHREVTRMIREKYPDVFNKLPSREEHEALKKEFKELSAKNIRYAEITDRDGFHTSVQEKLDELCGGEDLINEEIDKLKKKVAELKAIIQPAVVNGQPMVYMSDLDK